MLREKRVIINIILSLVAFIVITFLNETHTIGNLFSNYFSQNNMLEYCSYHIPHPLINKLQVKLTYKDVSENKRSNTVKIIKDQKKLLIIFFYLR